jgi:CcmD family protein
MRCAAPRIHIKRRNIVDNRNFQFMFYGFFAGWAIIGFYVVLLGLNERKLRRELDRVRQMVEPRIK